MVYLAIQKKNPINVLSSSLKTHIGDVRNSIPVYIRPGWRHQDTIKQHSVRLATGYSEELIYESFFLTIGQIQGHIRCQMYFKI